MKIIYRKFISQRKPNSQHWSIQFSNRVHESKTTKLNPKDFKPLPQPKNKFWADPFLFYVDNKAFLFFEEFDYKTLRGILKAQEINTNGFIDTPISILEKPFHLSSPYFFKHNNNIYLLPEQAESGEIALYQCIKFPDKWEKVATLLTDGYYVDPKLLHKDGIWWLFYTEKMSTFGAPSVFGKLSFSKNLFGPWQEHPMSPISMDCRYSRSGGAIIQENNQIIRVVQDCSQEYGYQLHLLKVTQLTEKTYMDEQIATVAPEPFGVVGIHTLNFSEHFTVIDSRVRIKKID
jgi:hypothetical protein